MPPVLVVVVIALACALPGGLMVALFYGGRFPLRLETALAAVTLGVAAVGYLALLLAELNAFAPAVVPLLWLVATLIPAVLLWRMRRTAAPLPRPASAVVPASIQPVAPAAALELLLLAIWLIAAGWLFFRPHEYVLGAADAGVYVSLGSLVAQEGGFVQVDAGLAGLDPAVRETVIRPLPQNPIAPGYLMPGFYVTDTAVGEITPQFFPLHPVWYAIAFSLGGPAEAGIRAALLLTGLWALLGSLAVYLTLRAIAGWQTAVFVLAALALCALQVWFARYPTTEMLTQYLLWAGLFGVVMWQSTAVPQRLWAALAGVALGQVFLVRIDLIVLLPLLALFVVWLWGRGWQRTDWWFVVPLVWFTVHGFVHAVWQSGPYFYETIGFAFNVLLANWLIPLVGGLATAVFLLLVRRQRGKWAALARYRRPALLALIGALLVFAAYGWFVRPWLGEAVVRQDAFSGTQLTLYNHENWRRLAWYLSPVGVWLGVLGSCLLLWRVDRRTGLLLAVGWLFAALYLWNLRANPSHIYVMRRYVPVVAPFLLLSGAYLVGELLGLLKGGGARLETAVARRAQLALGVVLAVAWLGGLAWSARGFVAQVDHRGLTAQLAALEGVLPPDAVLLFNDPAPVGLGDVWGTPLKYVYGREVYTLRDLAAIDAAGLAGTIGGWLDNGRDVVWIGDPAWLDAHGFAHVDSQTVLRSARLEGTAEHRPVAIETPEWILRTAVVLGREP